MNAPIVSKIFIYPFKSLDPVELTQAEIGIHSLKHDRSFALMGADGHYVNSKRTGRINQLKANFDLNKGLIYLSPRTQEKVEAFELRIDNKELTEYFEDFFELKLSLVQSNKGELQDVPYTSSATVISTATYESLLQDFPSHTIEDFRLRFRANIELEGVEAFWEERLFHSPGTGIQFSMGDVHMMGISPRDRCNVPPRNPLTGETDKTFVKRMIASREKTLPTFSNLNAFGNMYQLSVDTYLPPTEVGKKIRIGDPIRIGNIIDLPKF
jgi:uncharacterized protein YcbX